VGRLISSGSIPVGGFAPGMVLADRYRIIGLLGRGGMGEVYRADDLKLGQPVALKFLPKALADDPVRRERFYAEVRIARQVSHPNLCRVYDIGELDGRHFLTMEYIDGEDLASLLKRIGNLPAAKALDVAKQLCAGLAAAHDKGVLHRDLKPANVMIDGRGRVRITDFGLAVAAGEEIPSGDASGTPAYMAPEQFAGKGASVRSDIYALGLVLYEVYTGRKAFSAPTLAELRAMKEGATPAAPSEIAREMDPVVERVLLRCMERDPRQRPASVAQVAAALPGGDPLAAAIAAGETPSPEMVAASGSKEGLKPWVAWACLAVVILGIGAFVPLGRQTLLFRRMPLDKPPEVLVERAREILRKAGYSEAPVDSAFGFVADSGQIRYVRSRDLSAFRWDQLTDYAMPFWYRQSPRLLQREQIISDFFIPGIGPYDPRSFVSGEAIVFLDGRGRLVELEVLPPQLDESSADTHAPDWSVLFREAGLDPAQWTAAEPIWTPSHYADMRAAWQGVLPERPEVPMRIEAAAYRGRPVFWNLIGPWDRPSRMVPPPSSNGEKAAAIVNIVILAAMIGGGAFFARRNLRMGRGDRRGAGRLACCVFALTAVAWIFAEHHVPALSETYLFILFASWALFVSGLLWLLYIALEPFVRRRWPVSLISWSRLLSGCFRDPLVGRDLLVGCVFGVVWALLGPLNYHIASWIGSPPDPPFAGPREVFSGVRAIIPVFSFTLVVSTFFGLGSLFVLFLLRVLLRRQWAAAAAFVLILALAYTLGSDAPFLNGFFNALTWGTCLFVLVRFGLLATIVGVMLNILLVFLPITTELSAWYSGIGLTGLALLLGLTVYAFHTSLGGQPLFGRVSLED
jgi:serine/threonine-protein kinase